MESHPKLARAVFSKAGAASCVLLPAAFGLTLPAMAQNAVQEQIGVSLTNGGAYQNTGIISATTYGIMAVGGAGSITNSGQITGGEDGVSLQKGGSVSNMGDIYGAHIGVYIGNGVGVVQNSGTISAKTGDGVSIYSGGSLLNEQNGQIIGGYSGAYAGGNGSTITNAGLISAPIFGVYVAGSSTVLNQGKIEGGADGVFTAKPGATIENSGLIHGDQYGIVAKADTRIINEGEITGQTGIQAQTGTTIENTGTLSALSADGPAISLVGGPSMVVLGTGTQINGEIAGDNTASTVDLTGTGQYFGAITGLQAGFLNVQPGAVWAADGVWDIGHVVNAGTLTAGQVGTALTIEGDYTQTPTGTLRVLITPAGMSHLSVSGHVQLAGTLDYIAAPGTYAPKTYSFLSAAGGVSGDFTTISPAEGTQTIGLVTHPKPSDPPPPPPPSTSPSSPSGTASASTTPSTSQPSSPAGTVSSVSTQRRSVPMMKLALPSLVVRRTVLVAPQDGALFANSTQVQALAGLAASQTLMQHAMPSPGAALYQMGGWVQAMGNDWSADGAYKSRGGGLLAGFDHALGVGRVGLAVGYESSNFTDEAQSKARLQAVRVGAYGDAPLGPLTLSGVLMDGLTTTRTTRVTGVGTALANGHGNVLTAALQAGTTLPWRTMLISPAIGTMLIHTQSGAVTETSTDSPMAVRTQAVARTALVPYAHMTVSKAFITLQGVSIAPTVQAGVVLNRRSFVANAVMFAQDGTAFTASPKQLSRVSTNLAAGVVMSHGPWQVTLGYNANIAGNWHEQAVQGTLLMRF